MTGGFSPEIFRSLCPLYPVGILLTNGGEERRGKAFDWKYLGKSIWISGFQGFGAGVKVRSERANKCGTLLFTDLEIPSV